MSYDLMVFEKSRAPKEKSEFLEWYQKQTEWSEDHSYDDPKVSSPALQIFFPMVKDIFPPMNGPFTPDDKQLEENSHMEERLTDYCIGRDVIYMSFAYSMAQSAFDIVKRAAYFSNTGFFEAGGNDNPCFFDKNTPMILEGEWFKPTAVYSFQEVKNRLEKMNAKNRSFLYLTDQTGSYIQIGGYKSLLKSDKFTVEMRRYIDPITYKHQVADNGLKKSSGDEEKVEVMIAGNKIMINASQVLNLETAIQLFQDFYSGTSNMDPVFWTDLDL